MISAGASRAELVRHYATLTPEAILKQDVTSLARLRKEYGTNEVETALTIMVLDASMAFETAIDKQMALELAAELHSTFYWLSLEDCFVALQRLRRKPLFGKLDANKILAAFEEYNQERMTIADEISYNRHLAIGDKGGNEGTVKRLGQLIKRRPNYRKH